MEGHALQERLHGRRIHDDLGLTPNKNAAEKSAAFFALSEKAIGVYQA